MPNLMQVKKEKVYRLKRKQKLFWRSQHKRFFVQQTYSKQTVLVSTAN